MDILSYLTELIKTRKEVGISGLGTFYKKKSPGRYDVETHSFLPPSYTLAFVEETRESQSLIAYISKKRNISTEAATYYIDQFTDETIKHLSEKQYADFGEMGILSGTPGSLIFNPKDQVNFGFDFYGLPLLKEEPTPVTSEITSEPEIVNEPAIEQPVSFEQEPIITEEQLNLEDNNADLGDGSEEIDVVVRPPDEKPVHDDQPVYEEISEVEIVQQPVVSVEPPKDTDNYSRPLDLPVAEPIEAEEENHGLPFYVKIIIAFAIIAAAGLAAYFIKPDLFNNSLNKSDNGIHDNSELIKNNDKIRADSIVKADSIRISNEKAIQTADSIKKDSVTEVPVGAPEAAVTWEVIGASVINQKEADKFIAQMKAIGITAKVVPTMPGKRRLKISIATFKDEESAREGRKLLVTKLKDPGIYIYQNKHTHKP